MEGSLKCELEETEKRKESSHVLTFVMDFLLPVVDTLIRRRKRREKRRKGEKTLRRNYMPSNLDDALGPNGWFLSFSLPPEDSSGILK